MASAVISSSTISLTNPVVTLITDSAQSQPWQPSCASKNYNENITYRQIPKRQTLIPVFQRSQLSATGPWTLFCHLLQFHQFLQHPILYPAIKTRQQNKLHLIHLAFSAQDSPLSEHISARRHTFTSVSSLILSCQRSYMCLWHSYS